MGSRLKFRAFVSSLAMWVSLGFLGWGLAGYGRAAETPSPSKIVRLLTVIVPEESGLLRAILPDFEKQTGYRVEVIATTWDIYDRARQGVADLVISHYGYSEVEPFVREGFGLWPYPVFANQVAVIGPPSDPARIRGLSDAVEAFHRIAQTQSPCVVNTEWVTKYMMDLLWEGAGRPDRGDWYLDLGLEGGQAVQAAAKLGAYVLWGLDPFLRFQKQHGLDMQALLYSDPLLQRMLVSLVVNPEKVPGVNYEGATALQRYLLSPGTQVRIRAFRSPGLDNPSWWPFGVHAVGLPNTKK